MYSCISAQEECKAMYDDMIRTTMRQASLAQSGLDKPDTSMTMERSPIPLRIRALAPHPRPCVAAAPYMHAYHDLTNFAKFV